jgi:hypothetical protein
MATYDIAATRAAIKAILAGVTSLASVYDYQAPEIEGYPAAIFVMANEDSSFLDDANNTRVMTFTIWIICEVANDGLPAANALLDEVSKDVINALELESNSTLGGACDWMMPAAGARQVVQSGEGSVMYQELSLKVNVASAIV